MQVPSIAILGPTSSGKSKLALELALRMKGEIVCVDSTTVYKGFDIGTSKPSPTDRERIPHHLLDILEPMEPFSAYHFVERADEVISQIQKSNHVPIIVGGTYFYLRALQKGMFNSNIIQADLIDSIEREYFEDESLDTRKMHADLKDKDPDAARAIHPNDRYRLLRALATLRTGPHLPSQIKPEFRSKEQATRIWMKYALLPSRHQLNQNIVLRTENMIQNGLLTEVKQLIDAYPNSRALQSIGYAEAKAYLQKKLTEKQLRNEIIEKTRQFAKRQITWLRSDPEIRFIDHRDLDRVVLEFSNLKEALENL